MSGSPEGLRHGRIGRLQPGHTDVPPGQIGYTVAAMESQDQYRALFENMAEGVAHCKMLFDDDGRPLDWVYLDVNSAFERLTGLKDIVGKKVTEAIPGIREAHAELFEIYGRVASTGRPEKFEMDFKPLGIHLSISAYCPQEGHFAAVFENITERKRMEAELLRAQKLESLGTLAGGLAHDFNNILTVLLGNISLIRTGLTGDAADLRQLLKETEEAVQGAKRLTQQLLTFAKGGAPIKKTLDLGHLVRGAAGFAIHGSNCSCEFDLPDGLWPVEADQGQMEQVICNLVLNAAQAMTGGGIIRIRAVNRVLSRGETLPQGCYVEVRVEDAGAGVPEKHLEHMFEPYFTTKAQGRGLGLSAAYSIVRNHGGLITAESKPNEGSTFRFLLPATDAVREAHADDPTLEARASSGRVLIMDDDTSVSRLLERMLKRLGCDSVIVPGGAEALAAYDEEVASGRPFRLVIMDLTIPGKMGGSEAVRRLKEKHPDARVVVSSGYSDDAVMSAHADYGFDAALPKPYRLADVSRLLS